MIWILRSRLALALVCFVTSVALGRANEFSGIAKVVDGDTITIGPTRIFLAGIDAPQADQPCLDPAGKPWSCGMDARRQLSLLLQGQQVTCKTTATNAVRNVSGTCQAGGVDTGRKMVEDGWALATDGRYQSAQANARHASVGVWKGSFVNPRDWRVRKHGAQVLGTGHVTSADAARALTLSAFGASPPAPDCAIKGNINWSGVCIFHRPAGRWYRQIHLVRQQGDRWFCTAAEARAAGCRETRR